MGRRRLRGGAIRMLGNHHGLTGRMFRRSFDALAERFTLDSRLLQLEASRVAAMWVNLEVATIALDEARRRRSVARGVGGDRPGNRDLERLSRRQGLADQSYQLALTRLEAMAGNGHKPPSVSELFKAKA